VYDFKIFLDRKNPQMSVDCSLSHANHFGCSYVSNGLTRDKNDLCFQDVTTQQVSVPKTLTQTQADKQRSKHKQIKQQIAGDNIISHITVNKPMLKKQQILRRRKRPHTLNDPCTCQNFRTYNHH